MVALTRMSYFWSLNEERESDALVEEQLVHGQATARGSHLLV